MLDPHECVGFKIRSSRFRGSGFRGRALLQLWCHQPWAPDPQLLNAVAGVALVDLQAVQPMSVGKLLSQGPSLSR